MFDSVLGLLSNLIFIGVSIYSYFFMRKVAKERPDGLLTQDKLRVLKASSNFFVKVAAPAPVAPEWRAEALARRANNFEIRF